MAKAYWVATYRSVSDPDKLAAYAKLAGPAIQGAGGKFLARGTPAKTYEAGLNQRCVVIEFDSVAAATAAHDSAGYATLLPDDVISEDLAFPAPVQGKAIAQAFAQSYFDMLSDFHIDVRNVVVTDDKLAGELTITGTNTGPIQMGPDAPVIPPTGKSVKVKGAYFWTFRNGQLVEIHTYPDLGGFLMQVGLVKM